MAKKSNGGTNYRSAKTGRYVTPGQAGRNPGTTVGERRGGGSTERSRSAKSGRFVTDDFAKRNPDTTVTES